MKKNLFVLPIAIFLIFILSGMALAGYAGDPPGDGETNAPSTICAGFDVKEPNGGTVSVTPFFNWEECLPLFNQASYVIYYQVSGTGSWSSVGDIEDDDFSFASQGITLANDTTYDWYVEACYYDGAAGELYCQESENTLSFTTISGEASSSHYECVSDSCVLVNTPGTDLCTTDTECELCNTSYTDSDGNTHGANNWCSGYFLGVGCGSRTFDFCLADGSHVQLGCESYYGACNCDPGSSYREICALGCDEETGRCIGDDDGDTDTGTYGTGVGVGSGLEISCLNSTIKTDDLKFYNSGGTIVGYDGLVPCGKCSLVGVSVNGDGEYAGGGTPTYIHCQFCHLLILVKGIIDFILLRLVPLLAVLFLVVGGVMYIVTMGDPTRITQAKNIIMGAVIGLAIVYVAWLIINTVFMFLGMADWTGLTAGWFQVNCEITLPTP